jgi:two-component system sensor histidine kinase PilS (NtrC family)
LTTRIEEREMETLARMMIVVRVICAGGALSVIALLAGTGLETRNALVLAGMLFLVLPLSLVWWLVLRSGRGLDKLIYAQLAGDVGLATGMVYFTGGADSHLTVLYLVAILLASILLSMRGALVVATTSAVLYAAASWLVNSRPGPALAGGREASGAYSVLAVTLEIAFFYSAAVLSGYLARRMGVFGARLRSAATELAKVKMDIRFIMENMSSGFMIVDAEGRIAEFNGSASRMLAVPAAEAIGRRAEEVIGPVSRDLASKIAAALADGVEEERGEARALTREGREVPLGVSISVLRDGSATRGVVVICQDLTDVKRMAERMRLADRLAALGELSAALAHEIRTPLASICGSVEMLRDSHAADGENGKLLSLVIKESDRLKSIIDHFLEFARSRPSRMRDVALDSALAEVVCLVRNHPSFHGGVIVETSAQPSARAWVDEETVKQVFYNLALNAVEAMPSGGRLKIGLEASAGEAPEYAVVRFEDQGVGIDQADLKRIFEPFFTRKQAGTGLGLAIASKIVEEHGGRIEIISSKGSGTVATVYLPRHRTQDSRIWCGLDTSQVLVDAANTAE